jgi:hypothetical protein
LAVQEVLGHGALCTETLYKATTGISGGVGRSTNGQCGALSGGALAIGLKYGRDFGGQEDPEAYYHRQDRAFELTKKLHDRFMEEYGGILCKEIHQKLFGRTFDFEDEKDREAFRAAGSYVDKCTSVVGNGAKWAVEIILDEERASED